MNSLHPILNLGGLCPERRSYSDASEAFIQPQYNRRCCSGNSAFTLPQISCFHLQCRSRLRL